MIPSNYITQKLSSTYLLGLLSDNMMIERTAFVIALASAVHGFTPITTAPPHSSSTRLQVAMSCPAPEEGEREIIDYGPNGPVLVTKISGVYYAVDAKCPHLGLPMKKGKISNEDGVPTLSCNFHNSCFELASGRCTKWVTGALGVENGFISGIMGNVGNEKQDIMTYDIRVEGDDTLTITSKD
mmetsp:Transcript_22053/g.46385  ORF Transcript_22053/g.46385 Transcript_22053/m.46385 type:complete len:184 (-) Transcript_22053:322-873(-)